MSLSEGPKSGEILAVQKFATQDVDTQITSGAIQFENGEFRVDPSVVDPLVISSIEEVNKDGVITNHYGRFVAYEGDEGLRAVANINRQRRGLVGLLAASGAIAMKAAGHASVTVLALDVKI